MSDDEASLPKIGRPATDALREYLGVTTLRQVAEYSERDLLALHGVGPKAITLLRPALAAIGLDLKQEIIKPRIYGLVVADVYPMYIAKVERKGRTQSEVDAAIMWLTGYDADGMASALEQRVDFETFFVQAPAFNPDAVLITGVICGLRVEDIDDELTRKIRYLDKLIDEIARGTAMEKVLRAPAN